MLLAVVVAGFVMMTLGTALILVGEVPFVSGRRISAMRSRLIGAVLFAFLPMSLVVRRLVGWILGDDAADGPVVIWSMFGVCWLVVLGILFRVMFPKRPARVSKEAKKRPSREADAEIVEEVAWIDEPAPAKKAAPVKSPPKGKPRKPAATDDNPFDFS